MAECAALWAGGPAGSPSHTTGRCTTPARGLVIPLADPGATLRSMSTTQMYTKTTTEMETLTLQEEEDEWDFCEAGCPVESSCPNGWKHLQSGCYQVRPSVARATLELAGHGQSLSLVCNPSWWRHIIESDYIIMTSYQRSLDAPLYQISYLFAIIGHSGLVSL